MSRKNMYLVEKTGRPLVDPTGVDEIDEIDGFFFINTIPEYLMTISQILLNVISTFQKIIHQKNFHSTTSTFVNSNKLVLFYVLDKKISSTIHE